MDCDVPDPCIIVRLLLTRTVHAHREFFTVPTQRGLDLPSLALGQGSALYTATQGVQELVEQSVASPSPTACVGYVRNVVPVPDLSYPHPVPFAHVPVFTNTAKADPAVHGTWVTLDSAAAELSSRHWWRIVEHQLQAG